MRERVRDRQIEIERYVERYWQSDVMRVSERKREREMRERCWQGDVMRVSAQKSERQTERVRERDVERYWQGENGRAACGERG